MTRVDLKVVLLGSEFVGKTSLMDRYVNDRFRGNMPYQNTIGAAFAAKPVEVNGKKFVIGIWDTAGSERYEAMSRIYYRGAKAAIICYDINDATSWDRAKFWIGELRNYEEACKIYLCATKLDTVVSGSDDRVVKYEKARSYADGILAKYIETSSKTGENVDVLFNMIAEDYISNPENLKQVEETITLTARDKRSTCFAGCS